jgi:hypothetical protein
MVKRKTWNEFRDTGLLWWINMVLHTFGWAIVFEMKADQVGDVYPARVKYRGFNEKSNDEGYIKVSNYLAENAAELQKEAEP